jgi:ribosomal-protein-alanine N-acetyltransferase
MAMPRESAATPEPQPVRVSPMTVDHLSEVYAIEIASYPRPWPFKCFMDELTRNKFARYLVAVDNTGAVRGYAGLWMIHDEGHITNIAVDPEWRRRKIAEQILVHIIDQARKRELNSMFLEVRRYNVGAQMLYTRYKFEPISVRERYYADNEEDAIVLRVENLGAQEFLDNYTKRRTALGKAMRGE